jgi:nucleoside-diphosphate-sugar epimerase
MRILILGCGYVGTPLGVELLRLGHEVHGVRRSLDGLKTMEAAGISPIQADITKPEDLARIPQTFDWIVNTTGATQGSLEEYREVYLRAANNIIEWLAKAPPKKYVYTSSVGVYGQSGGVAVSELSPAESDSPNSRILVETEHVLFEALRKDKFPAVILRAAGIYGPGRGYYLLRYLNGDAKIPGQGDRYANMIHRDDLVGIIIAALNHGRPGEVYNAVDDEPTPIARLYRWLSETLAMDMPPFVPQSYDEQHRGSKRVSNRKIKIELGYQFKYATFRQGCTAEIKRLEDEGLL